MRVLLVDDNGLTIQIGRRILGRLGCTVFSAMNGKQAVEVCRREAFDVVLMDGRMPVMDGAQAIAEIRQLPGASSNVPILCTSSCDEMAERCFAAGANGFLDKPLEPHATRAALRLAGISLPAIAAVTAALPHAGQF